MANLVTSRNPLSEIKADVGEAGAHQRRGLRALRKRSAVPEGVASILGEMDLHLKSGDADAADAAFARLPDNSMSEPWYLMAKLKLARHRQDRAAVLDVAARLREISPQTPQGYFSALRVLRETKRLDEAEAIAVQAIARMPLQIRAWREAAEIALQRGCNDVALQRWRHVVGMAEAGPDDRQSAVTAAHAAGRSDLAAQFSSEEDAAPGDLRKLQAAARSATNSRQWHEAANLWGKLAMQSPENAEAAVSAAMALMGERPGRLKRLPAVITRLVAIRERFPDYVGGYIAHLNVLREMLDFDQAQMLADAWAPRFANDPAFLVAHVRLYEDRDLIAPALGMVERYRRECPEQPVVEAAYTRLLARLGRFDDAEAVAASAMEKFPADRDILCERARIMTRQGDLSAALLRWIAAAEQRPSDGIIARGLRSARAQLANQGLVEQSNTAAVDDILHRFESLGGTAWGCELGMLQQRVNAGSVGLFRWTSISLETLSNVLEHRLDGVGDEATTALSTLRMSADHEEYLIKDIHYGFGTHTGVKVQDAPADKALVQGCRRFRFLAKKMLEDLSDGDRIFAFKITSPATDAEMMRLHAALNLFGGAVALLCVMKSEKQTEIGTLREIRPGLFVGYIGQFLKDIPGDDRTIDEGGWRALCMEAEIRWQAKHPKLLRAESET